MTAYGECHLCGAWTGCNIYHGKPVPMTDPPRHIHPGDYMPTMRVWQCYDCNWTPPSQRQPKPKTLARLPGESIAAWRTRRRG